VVSSPVYIGKSGATEATIKEISDYLNAHEIVKVKILESCDLDPKYAANEIASMIGADFVQAIGRKFVLYRFSSDNHQIELPLR